MGDDLIVGLLAGEDRREHQAVVVAARFAIEERDLEAVGVGFDEVLEGAAGGHAGADDDELLQGGAVLGHQKYQAAMRATSP